MKKYIIATIVAMATYMMLEYQARGYFALGAEILFPVGAYAIHCLKAERE